jgi:hypothetical protein
LTFDEKKMLIAQIHKLPPNKMEQVLEIIQAALPPSDDNEGEIEIPLDALDTFTLRKLQKFIDVSYDFYYSMSMYSLFFLINALFCYCFFFFCRIIAKRKRELLLDKASSASRAQVVLGTTGRVEAPSGPARVAAVRAEEAVGVLRGVAWAV